MDEFADEELKRAEVHMFRAIAARANNLARDRSDLQFATSAICILMSWTQVGDWANLKSLARHLIKYADMCVVFDGYGNYERITVYVDTDWDGCIMSRKSTSGTRANKCLTS